MLKCTRFLAICLLVVALTIKVDEPLKAKTRPMRMAYVGASKSQLSISDQRLNDHNNSSTNMINFYHKGGREAKSS